MTTATRPDADARRTRNAALTALIQPLDTARYHCDISWGQLESCLSRYAEDYGLDLDPDFQRGHVWTDAQASAFIEAVLRRVVDRAGLTITFNSSSWADPRADRGGADLDDTLVIVDGLQRLTAVRRFMAGEITAFGLRAADLAGTAFDPTLRVEYMLRFAIHGFTHRAELLRHYLAINTGGTVHAPEEIARVRELLVEAEAGA